MVCASNHSPKKSLPLLWDTLYIKGLVNPMMSCSLSPNVDDAKVADVVIPHVLRRPHVQGPQYMHKFLLVDRSSKL